MLTCHSTAYENKGTFAGISIDANGAVHVKVLIKKKTKKYTLNALNLVIMCQRIQNTANLSYVYAREIISNNKLQKLHVGVHFTAKHFKRICVNPNDGENNTNDEHDNGIDSIQDKNYKRVCKEVAVAIYKAVIPTGNSATHKFDNVCGEVGCYVLVRDRLDKFMDDLSMNISLRIVFPNIFVSTKRFKVLKNIVMKTMNDRHGSRIGDFSISGINDAYQSWTNYISNTLETEATIPGCYWMANCACGLSDCTKMKHVQDSCYDMYLAIYSNLRILSFCDVDDRASIEREDFGKHIRHAMISNGNDDAHLTKETEFQVIDANFEFLEVDYRQQEDVNEDDDPFAFVFDEEKYPDTSHKSEAHANRVIAFKNFMASSFAYLEPDYDSIYYHDGTTAKRPNKEFIPNIFYRVRLINRYCPNYRGYHPDSRPVAILTHKRLYVICGANNAKSVDGMMACHEYAQAYTVCPFVLQLLIPQLKTAYNGNDKNNIVCGMNVRSLYPKSNMIININKHINSAENQLLVALKRDSHHFRKYTKYEDIAIQIWLKYQTKEDAQLMYERKQL